MSSHGCVRLATLRPGTRQKVRIHLAWHIPEESRSGTASKDPTRCRLRWRGINADVQERSADIETGAVLFGIALICFLLTGSFGPCGPGSLQGLIVLLIGLLSLAAAWIVSTASLLATLRYRQRRSALAIPMLVATPLAAALALLMKRPGNVWTWTDAGWVLFCAWPPSVAAVYAVQSRYLRAP